MMKTVPKGPFLGINNRLPAFSLHVDKTGDFLREAENVDIDNAGNLRLRKAAIRIQAMTGAHSLFTAGDGTRYLVRGSVLYTVTLPTYTETLFKILASDAAMSYAEYGGSLFFSNGVDSGRIAGGVCYPMALPTPASPSVTNVGGELFAGHYQVAVSYARLDGATLLEEGGLSPSSNYELVADGGLRITLPGAVTGATHTNVYVSTANGSVPMLAKTVALGMATKDVTLQAELAIGREVPQRYESPLPAGDLLFEHNNRLCSIKGNNIYVGSPFRHGYYEVATGRLPFLAPVTNAISAQNGVYITTTEQSYWFPGEDLLDEKKIADVLPYGAVKGTAFKFPHNSKVGWFGAQGLVTADLQGQVEAVMADNVNLTAPATGLSAVFSSTGHYRVVSCGWCVNLEKLAATTYTDYDFTSISGTYGTKADGIYDLAATGDVPYVIGFGKENFDSEQLKHLPATYLGCDSDVPMQLRVQGVDAKIGEFDYTYPARSSGANTKIQRVDPGKGLRANWFELSLIGEAAFTLATVSFAPVASTRKI